MVLDAVAFPVTKPIHEEAIFSVHHENCRQHVHGDAECTYAAKKSQDERHSADEFNPYCRKSHDRRQTYMFGQSAQCLPQSRPPNQPNIFCDPWRRR